MVVIPEVFALLWEKTGELTTRFCSFLPILEENYKNESLCRLKSPYFCSFLPNWISSLYNSDSFL